MRRALPVALLLGTLAGANPALSAEEACKAVGSWLDPSGAAMLSAEQVLSEAAAKDVVLLGESHDSAEHHRWQLSTLAALHGRRGAVVVGFEMFPRRVQATLDRWSDGEWSGAAQDGAAFLKEAEWDRVWGFAPELYLPLFHFVRQQRLPMLALNVERSLVRQVGDEGWSAIPEKDREGITDPAAASDAYRRSLAEVFRQKMTMSARHGGGETDAEAPPLEEILETPGFERFVEAQLTWDRAMAEALAEAKRKRPEALIVGIVGRGHAEYGHGIPHQLADLGIESVGVLLPDVPGALCEDPAPGLADAVFLLDPDPAPAAEPPRPRLGVVIQSDDDGVLVSEVISGSVAEAAGIEVEDIVVEAAGFPVTAVQELIDIIRRQAPGTWLPLQVRRGEDSLDIVARFPTRFGEDQ